jgi:hypothetical protein
MTQGYHKIDPEFSKHLISHAKIKPKPKRNPENDFPTVSNPE